MPSFISKFLNPPCLRVSESDVVIVSVVPDELQRPAGVEQFLNSDTLNTSSCIFAPLADSSLATIFSYLDLGDVPPTTKASQRFNQIIHSTDCDVLLWSSLVERYCPALHQLIPVLFPKTNDADAKAEQRKLTEGMNYSVVIKGRVGLRKKKKDAVVAEREVSLDMVHHDLMRRHFEIGASPATVLPPEWIKGRYRIDASPALLNSAAEKDTDADINNAMTEFALMVEISYENPRGPATSSDPQSPIVGYMLQGGEVEWKNSLHGYVSGQLPVNEGGMHESAVIETDVSDVKGTDLLVSHVEDVFRCIMRRQNNVSPLHIAVSKVDLKTGWQKTLFRGTSDMVVCIGHISPSQGAVMTQIVDAHTNECRIPLAGRVSGRGATASRAMISVQLQCRAFLCGGLPEEIKLSIGFLKGSGKRRGLRVVSEEDMNEIITAL